MKGARTVDLTVTAKGVNLSPAIERDIERKAAKLNRLYGRLIDLQLTFFRERQQTVCEIRLHIPRSTLVAEESADDARTALDQAMEKITRQLKRVKERRRQAPRRSSRLQPGVGEDSLAESGGLNLAPEEEEELEEDEGYEERSGARDVEGGQPYISGRGLGAGLGSEEERQAK